MKNILIDKSIKLLPKRKCWKLNKTLNRWVLVYQKSPFKKRVALTPESVELLINSGHKVYVEKDAGKFSNFFDNEYTKYVL